MKPRKNNAHNAILCKDVCKEFYFYQHRTTSAREWFIRKLRGQPIHVGELHFTLNQFELTVQAGESVVLIGKNGSGKSTALRLIAGIYAPTRGLVETFGRVAAVIELGAGFSTELTGAENIALYGAIMGLSPEEVRSKYDSIVEFSELDDFMNTPVKYYSSGMSARLAFAISVAVNPNILLLDEVLAVGDQSFRKKCVRRLKAFRASGGTMVVVSHDLELVRQLCERAIWLDGGRMRMDGNVNKVLSAYEGSLDKHTGRIARRRRRRN